jgi:radical SAM protein with 4Fe4S-binding SPASM domain
MSLETANKVIYEAVKLGAKWISFTGGEPFLEPELLLKLVEYANRHGLQTEIVSNGYWATSPEIAEKILKPLSANGLDVINLSLDDYHSEFIPVKHVKNAYHAALKQGLKIVIMTATQKNSKITSEAIHKLLDDSKIQVLGKSRVREPNSLLIETPTTPIGRGESIKELDYKLISEVKCGEVLKDIGVGPNGDVYPCCGPLAIKKTLGNILELSLESILKEARKDPIYASINLGAPILGSYSSRCDACLSLVE